MSIHCNTEPQELVDYLREMYIQYGAKPQMIQAIDNLYDALGAEYELKKVGEELVQVEEERDDLREELRLATESLELAIDTIASIAKSPADAVDMININELHQLRMQLGNSKRVLDNP
jgi:chaperonin cofactor prefoldin